MVLDGAVHGCQAHPCAFAQFLGGEERFEDTFSGGIVHTRTGIDYVNLYVAARLR